MQKKKLVDKLIEECTKNNDAVKIAECKSTGNIHKRSSCTLLIVLFSIIFTMNVRIGTYFVYSRWYLKKDVIRIKFGTRTQTI